MEYRLSHEMKTGLAALSPGDRQAFVKRMRAARDAGVNIGLINQAKMEYVALTLTHDALRDREGTS